MLAQVFTHKTYMSSFEKLDLIILPGEIYVKQVSTKLIRKIQTVPEKSGCILDRQIFSAAHTGWYSSPNSNFLPLGNRWERGKNRWEHYKNREMATFSQVQSAKSTFSPHDCKKRALKNHQLFSYTNLNLPL